MSQVSAEFIPTRIAILTVSNRRGEEEAIICVTRRKKRVIRLSIRRLSKKTVTPSAPRFLPGLPVMMYR